MGNQRPIHGFLQAVYGRHHPEQEANQSIGLLRRIVTLFSLSCSRCASQTLSCHTEINSLQTHSNFFPSKDADSLTLLRETGGGGLGSRDRGVGSSGLD